MSEGADLYEQDFVAWTEQQAAWIRAAAASQGNLPVDWENVAEEIESLGKSDRRELGCRLETIVEHLRKLQYSPASQPRAGWLQTVLRERRSGGPAGAEPELAIKPGWIAEESKRKDDQERGSSVEGER